MPVWAFLQLIASARRAMFQERRVALLGLLTDDSGLYRQGAFAGALIEPIEEAMDRAWAQLAGLGVDAIIPMTHQVGSEVPLRDAE